MLWPTRSSRYPAASCCGKARYLSRHHDWIESVRPVLSQGNQWLGGIAEPIRKLNDFRHAPEMLAETDASWITDLGEIEETLFQSLGVPVWQIREMSIAQMDYVFSVDAHVGRADLFIVPADDQFLREAGEQEGFRPRLAPPLPHTH